MSTSFGNCGKNKIEDPANKKDSYISFLQPIRASQSQNKDVNPCSREDLRQSQRHP